MLAATGPQVRLTRLVRLAAAGGCQDAIAYIARETVEGGRAVNEVTEALERLQALFEGGHIGAGLALARIYEDGTGVERNQMRALEYWEAVGARNNSPLWWKEKAARLRAELRDP